MSTEKHSNDSLCCKKDDQLTSLLQIGLNKKVKMKKSIPKITEV